MHKIIKILLLCIMASFLFSGCENMISDVDVPESEKKLFVFSVISPQYEFIKVKLTYSKPLFNQQVTLPDEGFFPAVLGALVRISEGENSVIIPYDAESETYILSAENFPIQAGRTYLLEVETPDGKKATSGCTVPDQMPPAMELVSFTKDSTYWGDLGYVAMLRFKDIEGSSQFYDVMAAGEYYDSTYNITNVYELGFSKNDRFTTDKNKDGEWFNYTTSPLYYYYSNYAGRLIVNISITDENYYSYHKSIWSFEGDNPFQEPEPVFTNITDGLGVFGALTSRNFEYYLPAE